jgi:adenine-specific DNA methylase
MRYYGCKTKLLSYIEDVIKSLPLKKNAIIFDIFSGTSAVGKHFKKLGYTIYANDFLEFAYAFSSCYIELNKQPTFTKLKGNLNKINNLKDVIDYLNSLSGEIGFVTKNYSPLNKCERRYLSVDNASKVDAIRKKIEAWKDKKWINKLEYYYLITALIEAINLVSNVTGTYAAYLKSWDTRALKTLKLVAPEIIESRNKNLAFKQDANKIISKYKVDVLYLDPPYNERQFAANYFLLELIAEGWFHNIPPIYGKAGMRPYEDQKSEYSMTYKASSVLQDLIEKARAKYIILSYNNEGMISLETIRKILREKGDVQEFSKEHKRYRSINQDGSNISTNELLFLVKVKE